jgi:hypothetical protein
MNIKRIIYTAAVVNDPRQLHKFIDDNMPNKFCHHVTLKFGNVNEIPSFIGKEVAFVGDLKAYNDKAVALIGNIADDEISNYIGDDHVQHITICTAADVKPVYSNNLLDEGYCEFIDEVAVLCRVGAFVVFDDDTTGWVYNK